MSQLSSTVTFILPVQNNRESLIDQVNTIFEFSEKYRGFCEIIALTDQVEDTKLKLAWLAIRLNKMNHPHVRTRIIRYTSQVSLSELIETSINHALGQRIVIATDSPQAIETARINDIMKRDMLITQHMPDVKTLLENLA
jgi:hypothetical protein